MLKINEEYKSVWSLVLLVTKQGSQGKMLPWESMEDVSPGEGSKIRNNYDKSVEIATSRQSGRRVVDAPRIAPPVPPLREEEHGGTAGRQAETPSWNGQCEITYFETKDNWSR